jgi:exodeoxyribonuclease VIII
MFEMSYPLQSDYNVNINPVPYAETVVNINKKSENEEFPESFAYPYVCNITNEEYLKAEGLSSSAIKTLLKCPEKFESQYIKKKTKGKSTKAMDQGSLIHTYILEKHLFLDRYFPATFKDRRSKAYLEAKKIAEGKEVVAKKYYESCELIDEKLSKDPVGKNLFTYGKIEQSYFWKDPETGILLKSRPDFISINDNYIVDIKKTKCCEESDFQRSIEKYKYYIQAAMQLDAYKAVTGKSHLNYIYFAIEAEEPFVFSIFTLGDDFIEEGRKEYKRGLQLYLECMKNNYWPGYHKGIIEINMRKNKKW